MSVDDLRSQLRDRGYLTHGIERWFALDPWSSRAFWLELVTVAAKAAVLIAGFGLLAPVSIMLFRNRPLSAWETLSLATAYGATIFAAAFLLLIVFALALKMRPALVIDTPRALLAISFIVSAVLAAPVTIWWYGFTAAPSIPELLVGLGAMVVWFLVATIAVSAALLSFSIYEVQRVPAVHQRSRTVPMTMAAAVLTALLFLPAYATQERRVPDVPAQIITTPTTRRIALIAIDGLTFEVLNARPDIARTFTTLDRVPPLAEESTAARWASVGTGVQPRVHGVHAVEGIALPGGHHLLQHISAADVVLRRVGRREPLPPTVRRRDYVWEIFARRSLMSTSVNWWTTDDVRVGALDEIGQASIFTASAGDAVAVDRSAATRFFAALDRDAPRFATLYLPALDILLNRQPLDQTTRLAASVRALDALRETIADVQKRSYDVFLIGLPGDRQPGSAVLGCTISVPRHAASPYDVAPTLCALLGFPASNEMIGKVLVPEPQPRINSYGSRASGTESTKVNEEYYRNLKSLGYIR